MTQTLLINITEVDGNGKPTKFEKNSASTATKATVDANSGNIDVSEVEDIVAISWTFADSTGQVFLEDNSDNNQGITFNPARGASDNSNVFGDTLVTNNGKTATLNDSNPDASGIGSNKKVFNYTIHDQAGPDDPTIRNR